MGKPLKINRDILDDIETAHHQLRIFLSPANERFASLPPLEKDREHVLRTWVLPYLEEAIRKIKNQEK